MEFEKELIKKFQELDLYNLNSVVDFCEFIHAKEFNLDGKPTIIENFSINSTFDNDSEKYIYLVDLSYQKGARKFSLDLEEFMKEEFNSELSY